jgi:glycosyltransferase involved in cell wall biosynthesis
VCTRNRARYVEACIKHLLFVKTDFQLEVIVRDNCSDDDTYEVISQITDHRLRYICSPKNEGWSTFLEGGKLASGNIITWVSDEDNFVFEELEFILNVFKVHPECNVLIGGVIVGPSSAEIRFLDQKLSRDSRYKAYLQTISFSGCAGVFVRKKAFEENCRLSFIDQYDAYAKQNYYQIGFIATRCLSKGDLITTSRIVAKEVRHAPTTDNWSIVNVASDNIVELQPHYYPLSIYDRLISSLATVWESRCLNFLSKFKLAVELIKNFEKSINASDHPDIIKLLSENYSSVSVSAYKKDIEKRMLHQKFSRKLWVLKKLVLIPFNLRRMLKIRQCKINFYKG